jgi:hypothetical protein
MTIIATNGQPMPDFLGLPWGTSRDEAQAFMDSHEGVLPIEEQSSESVMVHQGGMFAGQEVAMWILQFVADQLHTGKILMVPLPQQTIAAFKHVTASLSEEFGEPTQGGIVVNPPFSEGQEIEAIAAGAGMAAVLFAFGEGSEVEGSIFCQISEKGHVVTTYQHQTLNMLAITGRN